MKGGGTSGLDIVICAVFCRTRAFLCMTPVCSDEVAIGPLSRIGWRDVYVGNYNHATTEHIPVLNILRHGSNWATRHFFVFFISRSDSSGHSGGVWGTCWLIEVLISLQLLRWAVRGARSTWVFSYWVLFCGDVVGPLPRAGGRCGRGLRGIAS